jgi:hypothetical protein
MKGSITLVVLIASAIIISGLSRSEGIGPEVPVVNTLEKLGVTKPAHYISETDPAWVSLGKSIVYEGHGIIPGGEPTDLVSEYFVCTDCHNQVREDEILVEPTPESRLNFAIEHDLPFLQGTTFWGVVNRESWYNGDYEKKYGEAVKTARTDLKESIQLCAKECSSGRYLDENEMKGVLHYLSSLELNLSDLDLNQDDYDRIHADDFGIDAQSDIDWIRSKYFTASPASFGYPPGNMKSGYSMSRPPDAQLGLEIYQRACLSCHQKEGPAELILDASKQTFKKFCKHFNDTHDFNLYSIIRYGTSPEPDQMQYMPLFTKERMSNQQVEDLREYIATAH